jgi:hypothetical protein
MIVAAALRTYKGIPGYFDLLSNQDIWHAGLNKIFAIPGRDLKIKKPG